MNEDTLREDAARILWQSLQEHDQHRHHHQYSSSSATTDTDDGKCATTEDAHHQQPPPQSQLGKVWSFLLRGFGVRLPPTAGGGGGGGGVVVNRVLWLDAPLLTLCLSERKTTNLAACELLTPLRDLHGACALFKTINLTAVSEREKRSVTFIGRRRRRASSGSSLSSSSLLLSSRGDCRLFSVELPSLKAAAFVIQAVTDICKAIDKLEGMLRAQAEFDRADEKVIVLGVCARPHPSPPLAQCRETKLLKCSRI